MKAGIYKITINDTFYYGQSLNIQGRECSHRSALRNGKHGNSRLQRAYDKHQEMTLEVVLYCEANELDRYEQWFLDTYQPLEKCANMAICAESPNRGRTYTPSDEHRSKISAALQGQQFSDEHKANLRKAWKTRSPQGNIDAGRARTAGYQYVVVKADGSEDIYRTVLEAAAALNVSGASVSRYVRDGRSPQDPTILSVRRRTL